MTETGDYQGRRSRPIILSFLAEHELGLPRSY